MKKAILMLIAGIFMLASNGGPSVAADDVIYLGERFAFPAGRTRLFCEQSGAVTSIVKSIGLKSASVAHDLLLHPVSPMGEVRKGKAVPRRGLRFAPSIVRSCFSLTFEKGDEEIAFTRVVSRMNIHGYTVSVVEAYLSSKAIFPAGATRYTWVVNVDFRERGDALHAMHAEKTPNEGRYEIELPKGTLVFPREDAVEFILEATRRQPAIVGRHLLMNPANSYPAADSRPVFSLGGTTTEERIYLSTLQNSFEIHDFQVEVYKANFGVGDDSGRVHIKPYYFWVVRPESIELAQR